jgi:hypothetical protein
MTLYKYEGGWDRDNDDLIQIIAVARDEDGEDSWDEDDMADERTPLAREKGAVK